MDSKFPGSVVDRQGKSAREFLDGLFFATKGMMLLQVREITGLDTPAIQNWIGRGWVQKPVDKRYGVNHLARILLINMLRSVTKLETIGQILGYINGDAECREDDSIPESELYICVCNILDTVDFETVLTDEKLEKIIEEQLVNYTEPFAGARKKLVDGIKIILLYYAAALIKVRADKMIDTLGIAASEE